MKKILMLMLVMLMAIGITACGGGDGESPDGEAVPPVQEETGGLGLDYADSIDLAGYNIKYDGTNGVFWHKTPGYIFGYENDYAYFGSCDYEDAADGWDEAIENSKKQIFNYLAELTEFGNAEAIEQTVDNQTPVNINNIEWLKVIGTFKNIAEGEEYECKYVAYYTNPEVTGIDGDIVNIPFFVIGLPEAASESETLEPFIDEFVQQITDNMQQ